MATPKNKIIIILMVLVIVFTGFPTGIIDAHAGLSISQIQAKFPDGKYWNHVGGPNNPDGWTNTPCTDHNNCDYYGNCSCNSFSNAIQCMGYAMKVAYDYYGSSPRNWGTSYDVNTLKPGDYVRISTPESSHSFWVTNVVGDTVTYTDCNFGGTCLIRWGCTKTKQQIASQLSYISVAPYAATGGNVSVMTNSQYVKIGENITFDFNASGATNLVLYIYLNGVKQFEGMFNPGDTYTTNFGNAGHYNYGIVANYNGKYVESVWNSFVAVNPVVSTEKATYLIGDNATFSFNAAESTNLVLYIYLNGVKQFEGMFNPGDTYTRTLSATGQYNYGIVANYNGKKIESTWHSFTVNPSQCVITFNSQGGSAVESINTGYNTTISAPTNPTKTGYTFGSWYKEASCTNAWNFASDKVTAATTLYAKWTPNTYAIKFNINGGTSGTMASLAMTYDSSKALTTNAFKKTGYSFLGWATTSTGAVVYKNTASVKNLTTTKGATINLYAKWGAPILSATSYNYNSIKVSWAYAGSATSYKIYRATSATGTYSYVYTASSTSRSWVDTGQTTGKTYYYKVYPVAGGKTYAFSTYKYAKAIPTTPTVTLTKASTTSIKITWTGVSGATKYQVYRATSATGTYSYLYTASSTARYWVNTGLTAGKTYYYKVRAYHLEGTTKVYGSISAVKYLKI